MNTLCRFAVLGCALAVMGCAAPGPLAFRARPPGDMSYGYADKQIDPTHYSVTYADNNPKGAEAFLELRAAQIAQGAGVHYFAFDNRGTTVLRSTENLFQLKDDRLHARASGVSPDPRDLVPDSTPERTTLYYYAFGQIALLADDQAHARPGAMAVSELLARPMAAP